MNTSTRFAVAVHTLTLLATAHGDPITSELIARSVTTNPVVIRRVLGSLRKAKLVTAQSGSGGGWRLARQPQAITLCDVYRAVEDDALFVLPERPPNPQCMVGRNMRHTLATHFAAATAALEQALAQITLDDVVQEVLQCNT